MKRKILDALRPGRSWWALVGIVAFFLLPEIAALLWGEDIRSYFHLLSQEAPDPFHARLYAQLESLGDFSWINFLIGLGFVGWFFYERARKP